jgi:hypothetical protein
MRLRSPLKFPFQIAGPPATLLVMIERDFEVPFVADLALREKQIQQNYRPILAVHKWSKPGGRSPYAIRD